MLLSLKCLQTYLNDWSLITYLVSLQQTAEKIFMKLLGKTFINMGRGTILGETKKKALIAFLERANISYCKAGRAD